MIRLMMTLALSLSVAGCQSAKYPLPSCNGYAKRQLNKSMWNWEPQRPQSQAQAFLPETRTPEAFVVFDGGRTEHGKSDNPQSYKSCA